MKDAVALGAVQVHVALARLVLDAHGQQRLPLAQKVCALPKAALEEFFILLGRGEGGRARVQHKEGESGGCAGALACSGPVCRAACARTMSVRPLAVRMKRA